MAAPARKLISIVTPCYNEEENVADCYRAIRALFEDDLAAYDYEHIFCDNASTDRTVAILKEFATQDNHVKLIVNTRNFGPFRSTFNGLLQTKGDAVVVQFPADLQDPADLIPNFVQLLEHGYRVVYGIRRTRQESVLMRGTRKVYYRILSMLADVSVPHDAGEFQLIDRVVVEALRRFDDYYPYIRGMIAHCGFESIGVEYTWQRRKRGRSKNNLYNLIDQGVNGVVSFSNLPLRLSILLGFILAAFSVIIALVNLTVNLVYYRQLAPPGIPTLIVGLFFFSGVQLFFIGILGEYVNAIHAQVRRKILVFERERINFEC